MAKPKSLLKGQELTPNNHHPNTPLEWDASLHLHKKITVGNNTGTGGRGNGGTGTCFTNNRSQQ